MSRIQHRLIVEVVKFLEIVQDYSLKGKMDLEIYAEVTEFKLQFLKIIMKNLNLNSNMEEKISKILNNNEKILDSSTL